MSDDNNQDVVEEVVEGSTRAAWEGSDVSQDDIDWLIRSRRIPDGVACRVPGSEIQPDPKEGEYVVFVAHFERGFGLPSSASFFAASRPPQLGEVELLELTSGVLICSTDRKEALATMETEGNSNASKVVKEGGAGRQDG